MISSDLHDDYDDPPNIPAFSGSLKKPRKESMYEALTGAAEAFAKAITKSGGEQCNPTHRPSLAAAKLSPTESTELRMKNFEQLRYLQQLLDDGIVNDKEYMEQKEIIISSLRKLSE